MQSSLISCSQSSVNLWIVFKKVFSLKHKFDIILIKGNNKVNSFTIIESIIKNEKIAPSAKKSIADYALNLRWKH